MILVTDMRGELKGYNVPSSVWRAFVHNSTKKSRRNTKNWQKGCPCHGWHRTPIIAQL